MAKIALSDPNLAHSPEGDNVRPVMRVFMDQDECNDDHPPELR